MSGWISLHRKIMDHPFYTEKRKFSRYEAWIDLLMLANHQDNKFMLGKQLVEVKRGSFITSELKLMEKWDWGKEKLRAYLKLLESDGMIVREAKKYTLITICNYEKHSSKTDHDKPSSTKGSDISPDRQQTASRPSADQQPYTNNNDNNVNNENNVKDTQEEEPKTARDAYIFCWKKMHYTGHIQAYVMNLMGRGYTDAFIRELFLEMGARGIQEDERYMRRLAEDWITRNIYTRSEAKKQSELQVLNGGKQNAKHGTGHAGRTDAELNALSF